MICAVAAENPGKTAIIDYASGTAREVSYRGLLAGACRVALRIDSLGLPAGSRIVLAGGNSPEWAAAGLGIHLAGFTIVPLDPELSAAELDNILSFLEPAAAACESALADRLKSHAAHLIELEAVDLNPGSETFEPRTLAENQPLSIVFTSGSTSRPKGVTLSEKNFLHNIGMLLGIKGLFTSRDRLLNLLPLHHVYAFTATLLTPLCAGATVVYPRSLKSGDIAAAAAADTFPAAPETQRTGNRKRPQAGQIPSAIGAREPAAAQVFRLRRGSSGCRTAPRAGHSRLPGAGGLRP